MADIIDFLDDIKEIEEIRADEYSIDSFISMPEREITEQIIPESKVINYKIKEYMLTEKDQVELVNVFKKANFLTLSV